MAKVKKRSDGAFVVRVPCPCHYHVYDSRWRFINENYDRPTFRESYLVRTYDPDDNTKVIYLCHSFVTDGMVEYKNDGTTHSLAGQTVPLLDIE